MKFLAFLNWIVLGMAALMALLYAVVCLMMLPYPQLVENAGGGFDQVLGITVGLAVFTAVAGLSTWLLQKRHALMWGGQVMLLIAAVALVAFVWTQR